MNGQHYVEQKDLKTTYVVRDYGGVVYEGESYKYAKSEYKRVKAVYGEGCCDMSKVEELTVVLKTVYRY